MCVFLCVFVCISNKEIHQKFFISQNHKEHQRKETDWAGRRGRSWWPKGGMPLCTCTLLAVSSCLSVSLSEVPTLPMHFMMLNVCVCVCVCVCVFVCVCMCVFVCVC